MSPFASLVSSIDPRVDTSQPERAQLSQVDASMSGPTILFMVTGLGWLMLGTVLGLVSAIKLQRPEFLGGYECLTYGRVYPACINAMLYGWGCPMVFAVGLWIMARLCRTQVKHLGMLYVADIFWNLGVAWGDFNILAGQQTPVQFLEMPGHVGPLLVFSYAMIAMWAILCFQYRQPGHVYVSQWYILAAFFWFPWAYFSAELMIFYAPARGVVQAIVNAWFVNDVIYLWFAPVALAAIYYLLPKVLGRPIQNYYLSVLGFWTYALFAGWAGPRYLVYGPVPVWVQTVGVIGGVMMVVPVVVIAFNHHLTALTNIRAIWESPVLRFVVFGAVSFTISSLCATLMSLRGVNLITSFTQFTVGQAFNTLYAFFAMTMFGAVYFILPRVLAREWPSTTLIKLHFWCAAGGSVILVAGLYYFGWRQGVELANPEVPFLDIVKHTGPLNLLRVLAAGLLAFGHAAFFLNVFLMISGFLCAGCRSLLSGRQFRAAGGDVG